MNALNRMLLLVLTGLLGPALSQAATSATELGEKPLLWRVDGGGLVAEQYLFGTIHLPDPRVTRLPAAVEQAFARSEVVLTELKFDSKMMAAAAQASLLPAPQSLSAMLTPTLAQQLEAELKRINPQFKLAMFDRFKPWALASQLALLPMQLKHPGIAALDWQLAQRSESEGKRNEGLEQLEEQLVVFDELSQAEQILMLKETLSGLAKARRSGKDVIEQLLAAYLSGRESEIEQLLDALEGDDKAFNDKLSKALLDDRNAVMATRLASRWKTQPKVRHFVAVGAAHLIGEKSIVILLRKQGYQVTRVP